MFLIHHWITFALISIMNILTSYSLYSYYASSYNDKLYKYLFISCVFLCLSLLLILPVDCHNVLNSSRNTFRNIAQMIQTIFYVILSLCIIQISVVLPTSFFYLMNDDRIKWHARLSKSILYALPFLIGTVLLAIVAMYIKYNWSIFPFHSYQIYIETMTSIDKIITFVISIFGFAGLLLFMIYFCVGGSMLFFDILFYSLQDSRTSAIQSDMMQLRNELGATKDELLIIRQKYQLSGRRINNRDCSYIDELEHRENLLASRVGFLSHSRRSFLLSVGHSCLFLRPFIAIMCLLSYLILWISVLVVLIDRVYHSTCNIACGFAVNNSQWLSPLDFYLSLSASYFIWQLTSVALFSIYFVSCIFNGIRVIGIRLFCLKLYSFEFQAASSHSIVLSLFILLFMIIGIIFFFPMFAPQYTSYGSKSYCNLSIVHSLSNILSLDECYLTEVMQLISRSMMVPFANMFYFCFGWTFVICAPTSFIFAWRWSRPTRRDFPIDDSDGL